MRGLACLLALSLASGVAAAQSPASQLLDSARLWEAQQRPDLARLALEKLLAAEPGHPQGSLELGSLEIRSGNMERAAEILDELRRRHPEHPATLELEATLRLATRDRIALANLRRLVETEQHAEAAAAARQLYPQGPPPGPLGLEYWRIIASSPGGEAEARAGLREFVQRYPDDPRYRQLLDQWQQREDARVAQDRAERTRAGNAQAAAQRQQIARDKAQMLSRADRALQAGRTGAALGLLEQAQALDPADPWTRYRLARTYRDLGQTDEARELMAEGRALRPGDADLLYASALLAESLDEPEHGLALLAGIPPRTRSADMWALQQRLQVRRDLITARRSTQPEQAQAALLSAERAAGRDPQLLASVAEGWAQQGEPARGLELLRPHAGSGAAPALRLRWAGLLEQARHDAELALLLEELDAAPLDATQRRQWAAMRQRLALRRIEQLRLAGVLESARTELDTLLAQTPPEDARTRGALVRLLLDQEQITRAEALALALRETAPQEPETWVALGRVARAQGQPDRAAAHFRTAAALEDRQPTPPDFSAARQQLQFLEERREGFIDAGFGFYDKPGAAGRSLYQARQLTVELRVPRGYGGHFFAIVDAVDAGAGTLPAEYNQAALYGSVQAAGPGALAAFPGGSPQSAQGVDIGLGWESERLRADLGTTPLGFTVENWVGGLRWSDRAAGFDYGFNLSRRPVIGSLISYAGAVDPASGRRWGGVVASGLSARLGRQHGRLYTSASLGGYRLTGHNVLDNDHLAVRLAGDWRLLDRPDLRLDGGLAFTYWTYAENLGEYSFGHGGYYSPQQYLSLSPTLEITGRSLRWSYRLRGSVAFSDTVIDAQAFYPNDPALQAQAGSSPLPAGFAAPVYGPGGGAGVGYALRGALEYQLAPRWYLGGTLDLDRSEFYTPNAYGAYLRYDFDGRPLRIPFPPRPPRPYASF